MVKSLRCRRANSGESVWSCEEREREAITVRGSGRDMSSDRKRMARDEARMVVDQQTAAAQEQESTVS